MHIHSSIIYVHPSSINLPILVVGDPLERLRFLFLSSIIHLACYLSYPMLFCISFPSPIPFVEKPLLPPHISPISDLTLLNALITMSI